MFASILQLMGFSIEKPVNSPARENSGAGRENACIEGITAGDANRAASNSETAVQAHAQAHSARRTDVKVKVGKTAVSAKVQSKSAKTLAAASPVKKGAVKPVGTSSKKSLLKLGTESGTRPDIKSSGKSDAKPTAKPTTQASAKLGAKATHPVVAKVAAKTPVKAVKPGASTAPSKPALTIKNQKSAPKVAANKVNPVLKTLPKPVAKPGVKLAVTKVTKVAKELKIESVKPSVATLSKGKPDSKTSATAGSAAKPVSKDVMMPTQPATPKTLASAAVSPALTAAPVPPKAGRPSSRLAQLTVPSMAQSVASTAAKSSFSQSTALPLIVPPLPSATKKDPKLANNWKTKPVEQLTDAELLSMPDAEYMNEKQLAVFRLKLSILKQDILNSASDTTEHLREDTVVVPDPADRATIEEEHALELRTRDRERKLLKKIEQSINRIDAGDYGYCDETGEPIGVGRLLARPTATLSLEAQQRRELKQKMFGD